MDRQPARPLGLALAATLLLGSVGPAAPHLGAGSSPQGGRSPAGPGGELWEARYNGPAGRSDLPTDIAVDSSGSRIFVTGWSFDPTNYLQYVTISYGAKTGRQLWAAALDQYYSEPQGVAVSPDGRRVFVTGMVDGPIGDYGTVAYNAATGKQLWFVRYDRAGQADGATDIAVSPDGSRVFVTGAAAGKGRPSDYTTIAYDAVTGGELWTENYDGPDASDDEAVGLQVAPDGSRVYVTGSSCGIGTGHDYATLAYDTADGTQLWVARYAGPQPGECLFDLGDRAASLSVSSDGGSVYITGTSPGKTGSIDPTTVAYKASDGTQRWVRRYLVPDPNNFTGGASVGVSPDGTSVFVLGSISTNQSDFLTISYAAATGRVQWASTYNGPGNDIDVAKALTVGPDGRQVLVTGRAYNGTSDDYATLAYDARTGTQLWVALYNGQGNGFDLPFAMAIRPDGRAVYVTGNSLGRRSDDYLTIAYQA